jgi:hypothetical protein
LAIDGTKLIIISELGGNNRKIFLFLASIKKMVNTLAYIVADPKVRRAMEEEYWAEMNEVIWKQTIEEQSNTIAQKDNALAQKDDALQKALAELNELKQRFGLN